MGCIDNVLATLRVGDDDGLGVLGPRAVDADLAQHVMGRLFTRLGNVKLAKEEHKDLAKFFKAHFVESLVNINIKTLADSSLGKNIETRVPDRIVNLALQFLVSAVHVAAA